MTLQERIEAALTSALGFRQEIVDLQTAVNNSITGLDISVVHIYRELENFRVALETLLDDPRLKFEK